MNLLENKVALVTGAARGIGRAIAEAYAGHGAHVAIADLHQGDVDAVAEDIQTTGGGKALGVKLDVTNPASVQGAIDEVVAAFGGIDILVNNAGILRAHLIVDCPLEDWQAIFKVNMEGTFLCSQAAARRMIQHGKGGVIINVASCSARKADLKHAAYSSSKAAVICFTRILALELGSYGIRANALLPGATETEMLRGVFVQIPGIREDLLTKTALGRLATPGDQANAAVFLASDLARYITGEYLVVSGGEFMNA
jgi:NAD(P)-dependent dehydrogenase (short-subunit alcohol dehydrogenase family)